MGEIVVDIDLENAADRTLVERGVITEAEVRRHRMPAVVDTGAVMMMLPQDVVEKLGLVALDTVTVRFADERKSTLEIAGSLRLSIEPKGGYGPRPMITDCLVGPPESEALVGQVVLGRLDLRADCVERALVPRPGAEIRPQLKLK